MSNQAAFFQILYQNETLFLLPEQLSPDLEKAPDNNPEPITTSLPAASIEKPSAVAAPIPEVQKLNNPTTEAPKENFPALKHKLLILLDEPKQTEMKISEALFLDNILKAVGHSTDHADILNFSFIPDQNAKSVLSEKKTNFFITFGVPLIKLNLDLLLAPYTPKLVEGIWFLLADSLAVIEADRTLKKKLWQALQKMFEMS